MTQVRWLAGLNHTNGLHYAPYTLPFSFPKPQSHNLTPPAILIRRLKHSLPTTFYNQSIPILLSFNSSPDSDSRSLNGILVVRQNVCKYSGNRLTLELCLTFLCGAPGPRHFTVEVSGLGDSHETDSESDEEPSTMYS